MRPILLSCLFAAACSPSGNPEPVEPPVTAPVADFRLTAAADCDALRATAIDSVTEAVLHARYGGIRIDDKLGGKSDDTKAPGSETVELESEPPLVEVEDLVKVVDGRVFIVSDSRLDIVALDADGVLSSAGYFGVEDGLLADGMFVDNDSAVLIHTIAEDSGADFAGTRVSIVDVSDPSRPSLKTQFDVEGDFVMARRVGGSVNLVTSSRWRVDPAVWDIAYGESSLLPKPEPNGSEARQTELRSEARAGVHRAVAEIISDGAAALPRIKVDDDDSTPLLDCAAVWGTTPASSVRLTTTTKFDVEGHRTSFAVLGDDFAGAVADDTVFGVFSHRWGPFAGSSLLHRFHWDDGYLGSDQIAGRIVDEFSIDAQPDAVNVITVHESAPTLTTFEVDGNSLSAPSAAVVEDDGLVVANRITSNTAFIATHGDVERIFALPLGDSAITGPFEVGGIPAMIHTLDADRIFVVAQQVDENDDQIGVELQIFGGESAPDTSESVSTGEFAAWSEAMWEPRSLAYSPDGLVAFPVNIETWADAGDQSFSGVLVYDTTDGITRRAAIDHSDLRRLARCRANDLPDDCAAPPATPWWTHVRRSVFLADTLVTISDAGVKAHDATTFEERSSLVLE